MILSKNKLILFVIFYTGFLAGIIGNIKIGNMRLQFLIGLCSFFILGFSYLKWTKYKIPVFVYPILIITFMVTVTINNQFGFIQFLYMAMPLLAFLVGACLNYDTSFKDKLSLYLSKIVLLLCILSYSTFLLNFSQFDSRPLSIYISIIVLLSLTVNRSKYNIFLCLILMLFVLVSGARGALFACIISMIVIYFFEKLSVAIASLVSLIVGLLVYIFSELLFYYIFSIDYLRQRTFYDGNYNYSKLVNFEFNSSGRDIAWPIYWEHIIKRFSDDNVDFIHLLFGEGYGAVSEYGIINVGDKWLHPHNEIIRIIFDFGILGLFFIIIFWFFLIRYILLFGGKFERKLVIGLSCFTFIIMLTDNPLMYPLYYGNICLFILGYCYFSSKKRLVYLR